MEITGLSTLGDACESMKIGYEGEDSNVSFNPRFLMDPLVLYHKIRFYWNLETI